MKFETPVLSTDTCSKSSSCQLYWACALASLPTLEIFHRDKGVNWGKTTTTEDTDGLHFM